MKSELLAKIDFKKFPVRFPRCVWREDDNKIRLAYCFNSKKPRILDLEGPTAQLWSKANGRRSLKEMLRISLENGKSIKFNSDLKFLLGNKLLFLRNKPSADGKINRKNIRYLNIALLLLGEIKSAANIRSEDFDSSFYHLEKIENPQRQFTQVERTVSHTLHKPHPLLGEPYGVKIKDALARRKLFFKGARILEVGAGVGWLGKRFLDDLKQNNRQVYDSCSYTFLDLSNCLLKSQKKLNHSHKIAKFVQANAEKLPFVDGAFDYLIANENIADFRVVKLDKKNRQGKTRLQIEAWGLIQRYSVSVEDAPGKFIFPVGAIRFLEEIRRVLREGGLGLIIEYGSFWGYPQVVPLKGHHEYSIHFGQFRQAAEAMGFNVESSNLLEFLDLNRNLRLIRPCCECLLGKITGKESGCLLVGRLTPGLVKKQLGGRFEDFKGLRFDRVGNNLSSFDLKEFKLLILRRS